MPLDTDTDYYLFLIDIKRSTQMPVQQRKSVFARLENALATLNRELAAKPLLGLEISYGDEVSGLFDKPGQLYFTVQTLRDTLMPDAEFRFVVAYGKIGIVSDDIRRVGGSVFKTADAGINTLKRQNRFCQWLLPDQVNGEVLTSLCEMSNEIYSRMTPYQRQVYHGLRDGLSQKSIAERLKKHPQSVSDAVRRGGAELLMGADQAIDQLLTRLTELTTH
jgi:hypothetical protein